MALTDEDRKWLQERFESISLLRWDGRALSAVDANFQSRLYWDNRRVEENQRHLDQLDQRLARIAEKTEKTAAAVNALATKIEQFVARS